MRSSRNCGTRSSRRRSLPPRTWRFRIEDILEAIRRIDDYTRDLTLDSFRGDTKTVDAVVKNFAVIGEAAANLPAEVADAHSDVPWGLMAGMRNIVVHQYFGVDVQILWETAKHDLPPLVSRLQRILEGETPR